MMTMDGYSLTVSFKRQYHRFFVSLPKHIEETSRKERERYSSRTCVILFFSSFLSFFLLGISNVTQQLTMATDTRKYTKDNNEEKRKIDKPDRNTLSLLNEQSNSGNNRQCR